MNKYLLPVSATICALVGWLAIEQEHTPVRDRTAKPLPAKMARTALSPNNLSADQSVSPSPERSARSDPPVHFDNPMRSQLAEIAEAYRRNSRFPPYSQPLRASDWSALNPRAFIPAERPLANAPSVKASIELPYYVLNRNQDLPVKVVVISEAHGANAPLVRAVGGQVLIRHGGAVSSPVMLGSANRQGNVDTFFATVPATELANLPDAEVEVAALLTLSDGQTSGVTAMARLFQSCANLDYLGAAYVEGAHLVIPAYFQVTEPGLYRVQANLFSNNNEPVSQLNATFPLSSGNAVSLLKVHAVTLREAGLAGPYVLTDINIMRMPSAPGEQTRYGSSQAISYSVAGYPLSGYDDTPYQDPTAQQRLDFLESLSANTGNP